MNNEKIAKVYLDNQPISLLDPRPMVSSILFSCGKPESSTVQLLESRTDVKGKALRPEEVVDRTADPTKPIYLTSSAATKFGRVQDVALPASGGAAPVPKPAWARTTTSDAHKADKSADRDEDAKAQPEIEKAGADESEDEPADEDIPDADKDE